MRFWRKAWLGVLTFILPAALFLPEAGAQQRCFDMLPAERISLELRGADAQSTLRLFAQQYRINLVVTDEPMGTVTLSLYSVPVREVFRVIVEANALQCTVHEGVLRVSKSAPPAPPAPVVPIEVTAILSFPSGTVAILNNRAVKAGDSVEGHRVERIADTEVVLRQPDGSLRTLTLPAAALTAPRK